MPASSDTTQQVIESAIRLGLIVLIAYTCFLIVRPFVLPFAWAVIIAVAIHPVHSRLASALGGRAKVSLALLVLIGMAILIAPTILLMTSITDAAQETFAAYEAGTLAVPPPPAEVADWPLIGERLFATWTAASSNLEAFIARYGSEIFDFSASLFGAAAGAGGTLLHFVLSILIAAVLMANAEGGLAFAETLGRRLAGEPGTAFAHLSVATIRSVAQGVLGVALIQSILAGMGMLAVGVPGAGIWALLVLVLAVMQLPPLLILGPAMVYVFSANDTLPAVLFLIYGIAVSSSDTFLKPLLLGRGLGVPMLVILVGAIGGMIAGGVIGLFVGAVMLALAYEIFTSWLEQSLPETAEG